MLRLLYAPPNAPASREQIPAAALPFFDLLILKRTQVNDELRSAQQRIAAGQPLDPALTPVICQRFGEYLQAVQEYQRNAGISTLITVPEGLKVASQPWWPAREQLRTVLGIEEPPAVWEGLLRVLVAPPGVPETTQNLSLVSRQHLDDLNRKRMISAQDLVDIQDLLQRGQPLDPAIGQIMRVRFTDYLQSVIQFQKSIGVAPITLPESLARYRQSAEVREQASLRLTGMILTTQYDLAQDLTNTPLKLQNAIADLMLFVGRRAPRMNRLLDGAGTVKTDPQTVLTFLAFLGLQNPDVKHREAAMLLVRFLAKHERTIKRSAEIEGKNFADMTIADGLECCVHLSGTSTILEQMPRQIERLKSGQKVNIGEFAQEAMLNRDLYPARMVEVSLAPLAGLDFQKTTPDRRKQFQRDAAEVLQFFLTNKSANGTVAQVESHITGLLPLQQEMVRKLCKRVRSQQTIDHIQASLFMSKPPEDVEQRALAKIQELVVTNGEITLREAFELHYIMETGRGGDETGVSRGSSLLLGFKALSILGKPSADPTLAHELEMHKLGQLSDLAASALMGLELPVDLDIPPEVRTELDNARQYLLEQGVGYAQGLLESFMLLHRTWPKIMFAVEAFVIGPPASRITFRIWVKLTTRNLEKFATTSADEFARLHNVPVNQVKLAQAEVTKLLNQLKRQGSFIDPWFERGTLSLDPRKWISFRAGRVRGEANAFARAAEQQQLANAVRELRTSFPKELNRVADYTAQLSDDAEMFRAVMTEGGYEAADVEKAMRYIEGTDRGRIWALQRTLQQTQGRVAALESRLQRLDAPEARARFAKAKEVLAEIGYTDELTDAQKLAILDAHAIPPSLPEGQTGLWGSRYTVDDLAKKAEILREQFPHSAHWKALMRKGVCGDDLSTLIRKLSDTALEELAGLKIPPRAPGARIGSAAETAKSQKALKSLLSDREFLEMLKSGRQGVKTVEDAELFLEAARRAGQLDLDPRTLSMIHQSGRARKMLAGAISTGEVGEVSRVLKAATIARNTRIGLNVVGMAGDVFGLYMAYCDWQANRDRIGNTSNPALIDLYQRANYVYAAEAGASAVGIVVGGYAMINAYAAGEGVLGALSASGATIMLPIAVAVVGGGQYYRELESVTAGWLEDERDLQKKPEGELMAELLIDRRPGNAGGAFFNPKMAAHATQAEWLAKKFDFSMSSQEFQQWNEQGFQRVLDADQAKRFKLVRALLTQFTVLPKAEGEKEEQYRARVNDHLADQLKYLLRESKNSLDSGMMTSFDHAKLHAEMMAYGRALRSAGMEGILRWTLPQGGAEQSYDMAQYGADGFNLDKIPPGLMDAFRDQLSYAGIVGQFNSIRSIYGGDTDYLLHKSIQDQLLLEVRPSIAKLEGEILRQDFEGILQWDDAGRAAARYVLSVRLRQALEREADRMVSSGKPVSVQEYRDAAKRIKDMLLRPDLMQSPDGSVVQLTDDQRFQAQKYPALALQWHSQAFKEGQDLPNVAYYRDNPGKSAELLGLPYLSDHLFINRKYYRGSQPTIIQPRPHSSPTVENFRAQVPQALSADPQERELSVWVRNLEDGHEIAYRNTALDPQGLHYFTFTVQRPKEGPREGMNRPDFIPVLHRLAPDGNDTPQCRVYSDFFSSRDVDDRTKDIMLRTLLNFSSNGYTGPAQVRSFLSFFPYEVRNGMNYQEELIAKLTTILSTLNLKDADSHLIFFKGLVRQLDRYGGCTERACREIPQWFDSTQTNPLWERTPRVTTGTYRSPGRAPTKWPKRISF